jgi:hypothetical protein
MFLLGKSLIFSCNNVNLIKSGGLIMKSYLLKYLRILLFAVLSLVFLNSCVKDKVKEITDNSIYTPEYSLPVGSKDFLMQDIISASPINHLIPIDIANYPDNLDFLSYDSLFFSYIPYMSFQSEEVFQFSTITDKPQYITSVVLRSNFTNGIPGEITTQVCFLDVSHSVIDSIFPSGGLPIPAATINSDGTITESNLTALDIPLSQKIIDRLADVYYISTIAKLKTEGFRATGINYFSNQHFFAQFGIKVKLEIPLNEI